jgi:hypothetical protein
MELMLMVGLMTKHVIADYFLQYGWMIKDKGTYGAKGGLAHAGLHGILTLLVLASLGMPLFFSLVLGALDAVLHYHIDYVKSNVWKSRGYTSQDQMFWVTHGVDQFAHFLTYVGIILCLTL